MTGLPSILDARASRSEPRRSKLTGAARRARNVEKAAPIANNTPRARAAFGCHRWWEGAGAGSGIGPASLLASMLGLRSAGPTPDPAPTPDPPPARHGPRRPLRAVNARTGAMTARA